MYPIQRNHCIESLHQQRKHIHIRKQPAANNYNFKKEITWQISTIQKQMKKMKLPLGID